MTTKKCFKCGKIKPLEDFYANAGMLDGHLNKCKDCIKAYSRKYYMDNIVHYQQYDRLRYATEQRKIDMRRNHKNIPKERIVAMHKVSNALRDGRIKKEPCSICGSNINIQAHHSDYSKPLDVVWLCFRCHRIYAHGHVILDLG